MSTSAASQQEPRQSKPGEKAAPKRVLFIAGGVGINPLISMLRQIALDFQTRRHSPEFDIKFLYTTRDPGVENRGRILFLEPISKAIVGLGERAELELFLTGNEQENGEDYVRVSDMNIPFKRRRINPGDLLEALGPVEEREDVVCYVCGVPGMTDAFVEILKKAEGMDERNILFEKWW
ncbi:uncharacterized protein BP5553_01097 [Venustampulla echinocandica]|uniref:Uncharacterized protein n=1 Tax=Venustampulla echinocandica TaxID=2656787 RepID=A0A370U020_9HELO|nr:uncharacterized protein BP5553_01097 [Venustampulla echinocandica]RDL41118.1 hypothetical protein BP5553_01097 [Venustampulla echinocandica]